MNTAQEIRQAIEDFNNGRFGTIAPKNTAPKDAEPVKAVPAGVTLQ
jgi:hypothetical protein